MKEILGFDIKTVKSIIRQRAISKTIFIILDILVILIGSLVCHQCDFSIYRYISIVLLASLGLWFLLRIGSNSVKAKACEIYRKYSKYEIIQKEIGIDDNSFDDFLYKTYNIRLKDTPLPEEVFYFLASSPTDENKLVDALLGYEGSEVANFHIYLIEDKKHKLHLVNMKEV